MHHLATVKSNLVDAVQGQTRLGCRTNDLPVCPKPRRPASSSIPELLKCSEANHRGRSDIHNVNIANELTGKERDMSICYYYSGSPPSRTDNALVHDVHFIHQVELFSPLSRSKFADKFAFASTSPYDRL